MTAERSNTRKENVWLLVAALVISGVAVIPQLHLYLIDIVGTVVLLMCSGGEAGDGLPMWLSAIIAGLANVLVLYYLFKLVLKFWKDRRKQWER